jgi:phosphinothricin acetyltransferase
MPPLVRPAREEDLERIVGIYNHYVLTSPATFDIEPVAVADRHGWFDAHSRGGPHRLLVSIADGGTIEGWTTSSPFRARPAYATTVECSVYCAPEATGVGVGTRLYAALFRAIGAEDLERAVAGVTLPNDASLALHSRFGFRRVGTFTRVGRKFGRYWDVAWFERPARAAASERPPGPEPSGPPSGAQRRAE